MVIQIMRLVGSIKACYGLNIILIIAHQYIIGRQSNNIERHNSD